MSEKTYTWLGPVPPTVYANIIALSPCYAGGWYLDVGEVTHDMQTAVPGGHTPDDQQIKHLTRYHISDLAMVMISETFDMAVKILEDATNQMGDGLVPAGNVNLEALKRVFGPDANITENPDGSFVVDTSEDIDDAVRGMLGLDDEYPDGDEE